MSIEIKYKDELGAYVSSQQLGKQETYDKLTFKSGNLKIIESFYQSGVTNYKTVYYFLEPDEYKTGILQRYTSASNNVSCIIYFNKESANNINLWDFEEYGEDGKLYFKGKEAFDKLNRIIFHCTFDLSTNQMRRGATKHYYGSVAENPTDDSLLDFDYGSNGNLDLIIDVQEKFGYIEGISLDEYLADAKFSQVDFPWNQHLYYHAVTPYLPSGEL
jgi:hypothetical protein